MKETEQAYETALREFKDLKTKINELELLIVDNADARRSGYNEKLDSAVDKLVKFTDSMIAESERAWGEYRLLEQEIRVGGASESSGVNTQMEALQRACKKTDKFATDLLCYSLAHFKRKDA